MTHDKWEKAAKKRDAEMEELQLQWDELVDQVKWRNAALGDNLNHNKPSADTMKIIQRLIKLMIDYQSESVEIIRAISKDFSQKITAMIILMAIQTFILFLILGS